MCFRVSVTILSACFPAFDADSNFIFLPFLSSCSSHYNVHGVLLKVNCYEILSSVYDRKLLPQNLNKSSPRTTPVHTQHGCGNLKSQPLDERQFMATERGPISIL